MKTYRLSTGMLIAAVFLSGCGGGGSTTPAPAIPHIYGSSTAGLVDGPATTAEFSNPATVTVASDGTVYVSDYDNDAVRAISSTGVVSTLTKQSNFSRPFGLAMSSTGQLFVETDANDQGARDATTGTVWQVDRSTGVPTVIARNLGRPRGLVVLADGRIVMTDLVNSTVSILDPSTGTVTPIAGTSGKAGFSDGTGTGALFARPYGAALMSDGSILLADQTNNRIRRVTLSGVVTTFAGTGAMGAANGAAASATFNAPEDVSIAPDGSIYVADEGNHLVRRIYKGQVTTEAGNGVAGFVDASGVQAEFYGLEGIALAPGGHRLWIGDGNNGDGSAFNRVRWITVP